MVGCAVERRPQPVERGGHEMEVANVLWIELESLQHEMRRRIQLPCGLQGVDERHANRGRTRVGRKQPTIDIRCGGRASLRQHDIRQFLGGPELGRTWRGDASQALNRLGGSVQNLQGPREIALQFRIAALVTGGAAQQIEGGLGTAALKGDPSKQMQGAGVIRVAGEDATAFHLGGQELAGVRERRRLGKLAGAARDVPNWPARLIHIASPRTGARRSVKGPGRIRADCGGSTPTRSPSSPSWWATAAKSRAALWEGHAGTLHRDRPHRRHDRWEQSGTKLNVLDMDVPASPHTPFRQQYDPLPDSRLTTIAAQPLLLVTIGGAGIENSESGLGTQV